MDTIRAALRSRLDRIVIAMWVCGTLGITAMTFLAGKWGEGSVWDFLCFATSIIIGACVAGIVIWHFLAIELFDIIAHDMIAQLRKDVNLGKITGGKITCTGINVVGPDGTPQVRIDVHDNGGRIEVHGKDDKSRPRVLIEAYEDGGRVFLRSKVNIGEGNSSSAVVSATEQVANVAVCRNKYAAAEMETDKNGGRIGVYDRRGKEVVGMGVTQDRNGLVYVWDKDGGNSATLQVNNQTGDKT